MTARLLLVVLMTALALAITGCGGDDDEETSASGEETVTQTETTEDTTEAEETTEAEAIEEEGTSNAPNAGGEPVRSERVEMLDFEFDPQDVTIAVGGKVTWINAGETVHNAVADDDSFATEDLDAGKIASETFDEAGSYPYICTIHPQMTGTIEVVE